MKTIGIILLAFLLVATTGYLALYKPWKVTDPNNPNFDPENFRFENYTYADDLQNALSLMFPIGTKPDEVHKILVQNAAACYSKHIPADQLSLANNLRPEREWNKDNYLIEYMQNKQSGDDSQRAFVLFLFNGKSDSLIAIKSTFVGPAPFFQSIGGGVNYPRWVGFPKKCNAI